MRAMPFQFMTWGTITAAVGSAAWLSSIDPAAVICSTSYRATSAAIGLDVGPAAPVRIGPSAKRSGSGAASQLQARAN